MATVHNLQERIDALAHRKHPPVDPPGGGDNGGMEIRISKLEVAVEYIKRDISEIKSDVKSLRDKVDSHFLITGAMIIATALGLAGLMAKGFHWL